MIKSLLKNNIRSIYGFDVEKLKPNAKIKRTYRNGFNEIMKVKKCNMNMLWLMNDEGICFINRDCYSADEYYHSNINLELVEY